MTATPPEANTSNRAENGESPRRPGIDVFHARMLNFDSMAVATKYEVGDRILVEHVVLAVWDDGHVTYEVHGTSTVFKATVRGDDDSIREVIKGTRPKRRLTADDEDEVD